MLCATAVPVALAVTPDAATAVEANVGGESAEHTEGHTDRPQPPEQHEVVAGGGDRVDVVARDQEHDEQRHDHAAGVELPLAGLAEDEKDENRVEYVVGGGHGAMIARPGPDFVGAGVELGLICSPQPAG